MDCGRLLLLLLLLLLLRRGERWSKRGVLSPGSLLEDAVAATALVREVEDLAGVEREVGRGEDDRLEAGGRAAQSGEVPTCACTTTCTCSRLPSPWVEAASPVASRLGVRRGPILELTTILRTASTTLVPVLSTPTSGREFGMLEHRVKYTVTTANYGRESGVQEYVFRF